MAASAVSDPAGDLVSDPPGDPVSGPPGDPVSDPPGDPVSDPRIEFRAEVGDEPARAAREGAAGRPTSMTILRRRSDEQLVERFRNGADDAFRVIHDRYRVRLRAYLREMLAGRPKEDVEDVLQDVFERAARSVLADGAPIGLRAWLYSIARNRCIDELRRRPPAAHEVHAMFRPPAGDTTDVVERRAEVDRLFRDLHDLPELQRSALLMRELQGLSHVELGQALDTSVPAVKSLLVRARVGLIDAQQARNVPCAAVRESLAATYDRGVKPRREASQHLRECDACTSYRVELRRASRRLAALAPGPVGLPLGLVGRLLGRLAAHSQTPAAATGAAGSGGIAFVGAGKLAAALSAAAILTTGAALERDGTLGRLVTSSQPPVGAASASGGGSPGAYDARGTPGGPTTGNAPDGSTARGPSTTLSGGLAFVPGQSGAAGGRPGSGEPAAESDPPRAGDGKPDGAGASSTPTSVAGDDEPSGAASSSAAGGPPTSRPPAGALAPAGAIGPAMAGAVPAVVRPSGALSRKPPPGAAGSPAAVLGGAPAVVGGAVSAVAGAPAGVAGEVAGPASPGTAATAGSSGGAQSADDAQSAAAGGSGVTGAVSGVTSSVAGVAGKVGLGGGSASSSPAQALPVLSGPTRAPR